MHAGHSNQIHPKKRRQKKMYVFFTRNFGFLVLDNLQEQNYTYMYIVHGTVDIYVLNFDM